MRRAGPVQVLYILLRSGYEFPLRHPLSLRSVTLVHCLLLFVSQFKVQLCDYLCDEMGRHHVSLTTFTSFTLVLNKVTSTR